jgi:hypothetical protein
VLGTRDQIARFESAARGADAGGPGAIARGPGTIE